MTEEQIWEWGIRREPPPDTFWTLLDRWMSWSTQQHQWSHWKGHHQTHPARWERT